MRPRIVIPMCLFAGALVSSPGAAKADYDDCILSGMKGVVSDAGSRMVARACASKRNDAVVREYGERVVEKDSVVQITKDRGAYANGKKYVTVKNISPTRTVTYLRLMIKDHDFYDFAKKNPAIANSPDQWVRFEGFVFDQAAWQRQRSRHVHFKLKLPPLRSIVLVFDQKDASFYAETDEVRARENKWSDDVTGFLTNSAVAEDRDPLQLGS